MSIMGTLDGGHLLGSTTIQCESSFDEIEQRNNKMEDICTYVYCASPVLVNGVKKDEKK